MPTSVRLEKKYIFLHFSGYGQVEHNGACSASIQTISADHAEVSHFSETILHPKKAVFFIFFGVFFDTQT